MNTFVDRRGDVSRGDFDGVGYGTIAATSNGAAQLAAMAAQPKSAPSPTNPFTGATSGSSMFVGIALIGGLLVLLKMRKVI
jgi:hypothetical protein